MFDIIAIGGATRDITFLTDKGKVVDTPEDLTSQRLLAFEYGAKIRSEEVYESFGGGACNAAATFSNLGLKVAVLTRVGYDGNGKMIMENLKNRSIDTGLVQIERGKGSAFSFIVVDKAGGEGERVIFSHKGAANDLEVHAEDIRHAKWIYLTGLGDGWEEKLDALRSATEDGGARLAWNPGATEIAGGRDKLLPLLAHTQIFIINKDEAIELVRDSNEVDLSEDEYNDIDRLLRIVRSWGADSVVITDGRNGAHFFAGGDILSVSAFAEEQADTTGAGDAFGSGFLAGYFLTENFETALRYAVLNSGGEVSELGAQSGIMTRTEIEKKLPMVQIEKHN